MSPENNETANTPTPAEPIKPKPRMIVFQNGNVTQIVGAEDEELVPGGVPISLIHPDGPGAKRMQALLRQYGVKAEAKPFNYDFPSWLLSQLASRDLPDKFKVKEKVGL